MRIVCISDTHQMHRNIEVPDGDVLIHAGDITGHGVERWVVDFNNWLGELPHKHKIVIAGNHDFIFENHPEHARSLITNATYLEDSGVEIEGFKFWGSPWSTEFGSWAFMGNELRLADKYSKIPDDTNILITHGAPYGMMDEVARIWDRNEDKHVGSRALVRALQRLDHLRLHVFGHIHEAAGTWVNPQNGRTFVNAATCDLSYHPVNPPVVVELV